VNKVGVEQRGSVNQTHECAWCPVVFVNREVLWCGSVMDAKASGVTCLPLLTSNEFLSLS